MIKCEKGEVFITGLATDAIAEWATLTVHMVAHLERGVKENEKITMEEAIEIVEKPFKEELERAFIAAKLMNGIELEDEAGLDSTTEKIISLIRNSKRMSQMDQQNVDAITLNTALECPVWMMGWAVEPQRRICVQMTYDDLVKIVDLMKKNKGEEQ